MLIATLQGDLTLHSRALNPPVFSVSLTSFAWVFTRVEECIDVFIAHYLGSPLRAVHDLDPALRALPI